MVDSQAQISIIKINQIQIDQVNKQEIVRITGVTPGIIRTEGSVIMQLNFDKFVVTHKFHVVQDDFNIPTDGIVGHDFVKANRCNLCFEEDIMTIKYEDIDTKLNYMKVQTKTQLFCHRDVKQ